MIDSALTKQMAGLNKLMEDLDQGKTGLFSYGISDSQKAFFIWALAARTKKQILVVTADSLEAKRISEDLEFFVGPEGVAYFPAATVLPYETAARSLETMAERLTVMEKLARGQSLVVVAPIQALFSKMVLPSVVRETILHFKMGQSVPLEEILRKLAALGYERVDMIEGKGQFARRGDILDIYPLTRELPLRLEFFDDEVDSIREFSPEDQRSVNKLFEVSIPPAREVIYGEKEAKRAAGALAEELGEKEHTLKALGRGEVFERLSEKIQGHIANFEEGLFFESSELYISYLHPKLCSILDYFKKGCLKVMAEPDRIRESRKNSAQEAQETYKGLLEKGELLASQAGIYYNPFEIAEELKRGNVVYMSMLPKIHPEFSPQGLYSFQLRSTPPLYGKPDLLWEEISRYKRKKYKILVLSGTRERGEHLVNSFREKDFEAVFRDENIFDISPGQVAVAPGSLERGFELPELSFVIISDKDVYGRQKRIQQRPWKTVSGKRIAGFQDLKAGDYVVHISHGIGRYLGVESLEVGGFIKDYFAISYLGGDKLYIPTNQVDLIQKYMATGEGTPKLNKLGGTEWIKAKTKAKESVKQMAEDLVKLYAAREAIRGIAYSPDTPWQKEFEDAFPYVETPDQITAIEDAKHDMERDRPMDRLLCGDVGYGKTEVALRASFKAVMEGKQVAVLVPTTILAQQHYNTFTERFEPFPVKVEVISRFKSPSEQKRILAKLKSGEVDIIIGTHRLLQRDVKFKDLGFLVVDEEQRFGVSHKEKIKQLRKNVDVLTLTATPIPRTMHMALSGVRDMSIIETPPEDRFPIQTYVVEHNESLLRDAIMRELARGGQVYYLYNRVETISDEAKKLRDIIPEARVAVAHGQMHEDELENVMMKFYDNEFDVLVCTTIIETGLDIPNVNTLIVTSADRLGLSQLYQLRGRVGRTNRQAFAYLTYKKDKVLSELAEKRLSAIREFTEFGAGFKIALRDLEIRGAGNLLGAEQHGHMAAVGYDIYTRLLESAVKEIRGVEEKEDIQPVIELEVSAYISGEYIEDISQKMQVYRRIAAAETVGEVDELEEEVEDRFGDIPEPVRNLLEVARIRINAKSLGITGVISQGDVTHFKFGDISDETASHMAKAKALYHRQLWVPATNTPTFILKNRGEGLKMLERLRKFLGDLRTLHETKGVV